MLVLPGRLMLETSSSRVPPLSASDDCRKSCTVGMAATILSLLSSAWFPLDLSAHQDALVLAGNLLAGMSAERGQEPKAPAVGLPGTVVSVDGHMEENRTGSLPGGVADVSCKHVCASDTSDMSDADPGLARKELSSVSL